MKNHINANIITQYDKNFAIFLKRIYNCISYNISKNHNVREGKCWTYNTVEEFCKIFPHWTKHQIRYLIQKIKNAGLIETGCYNEKNYDRTTWYTLTEKALAFFPNLKKKLESISSEKEQNIDENQHYEEKESKNSIFPDLGKIPNPIPYIPNNIINNNNKEIYPEKNEKPFVVENFNNEEEEEDLKQVEQKETEKKELEAKKQKLEMVKSEINRKIADTKGDEAWEHLKKYNAVASQISDIELNIQKINKEREKITKKSAVYREIDYLVKKPGERKIGEKIFQRLCNGLASIKNLSKPICKLANEIIFEVRYGSLTKRKGTQESLEIEHGVNIALKLVREQRWTTPNQFEQYLKTS